MKIEIGQIISQILSFLIMLWILKKFAWKPILQLLEDRRNKIKSQFDDIDEKKKQLSIQQNEYEKKVNELHALAQDKIREAVETGQVKAQEIQEKARSQAKGIIEKAEITAQNEIQKAQIQLKDEIVNLTLAATEKIFQSGISKEKQKDLILDFLQQQRLK